MHIFVCQYVDIFSILLKNFCFNFLILFLMSTI